MNVSVAIVGLGVVGSAMQQSFILKNVNIIATYDKYKDTEASLKECLAADIIFLCLPTPFKENSEGVGGYDKTELHLTLQELKEYTGLVVIKSTVEPGTTDKLQRKSKLTIAHNPEFLTAATAFTDFHTQKHIVIGSNNDSSLLESFYSYYYPDAHISRCSSVESESMKIFINNFYAVKIQFFNELYLSCLDLKADYTVVRDMMLRNGWINPQHTQVPGPDGLLSYGGMCFPKDTCALASYLRSRSLPFAVIEATIRERENIREKNDFPGKVYNSEHDNCLDPTTQTQT